MSLNVDTGTVVVGVTLNTPTELRTFARVPAKISDDVLNVYLGIASNTVRTACTDGCYTAGALKTLELLLASHNLCLALPDAMGQLTSQTIGPTSETYVRKQNGTGMQATPYSAIIPQADCAGQLKSAMTPKVKVGVTFLGPDDGLC